MAISLGSEPSPLRPPARVRGPVARSGRRSSRYLTMRDGVRLAVDLWLPEPRETGERLPTILRQTRYHRSVALKPLAARFSFDVPWELWAAARRRFLAAGYAWVDVDVRGSGASFGTRPCPWAPDEVRDGAEVVDWIIAQPWSSGRVGAAGISYDGTTAEMLLVNQHPAVRAVAPMFSLYDVYADVAFPGGIHLAWFTEAWAGFNRTLDRDAFPEAMAQVIGLMLEAGVSPATGLPPVFGSLWERAGERVVVPALAAFLGAVVRGVRRTDEDGDGALLAAALRDHAQNVSVHEGAMKLVYRDDAGISEALPDGTIDTFSPHAHRAALEGSGAAVYSYGGWFDGAYSHSVVKRHLAVRTPGSRLIVGPWCHAGRQRILPFQRGLPAGFDHTAELLAFFDHHLKGEQTGIELSPPVHYYTLGEEAWKAADTWPPPAARPCAFYLGPERTLVAGRAPQSADGEDLHAFDPLAGTGLRSRWRGLLALLPADYPDRAQRARTLLCYASRPLEADLEVTGHPILVLHLATHAEDLQLFAYLEDEDKGGRIAYVTEGQLRALHRRESDLGLDYRTPAPPRAYRRGDGARLSSGEVTTLRFDLLPISYLFRRGHSIRLVLAGADRDHFAPPPHPGAEVRLLRTAEHPSHLELPVIG